MKRVFSIMASWLICFGVMSVSAQNPIEKIGDQSLPGKGIGIVKVYIL